MTTLQIIQAWKDPAFRAGLSEAQREALPDHPSGGNFKELDDAELQRVAGARELPSCWVFTEPLTSCGHICTATTECPRWTFCACLPVP